MSSREELIVCTLGRVPYERAWALQEAIQDRLVSAKRDSRASSVPHVLLLLEHPHVYTIGKSGDRDHLLASEDRLEALGASYHRIGRGGDITYHGPGQLVGYPLLDLDRFFTDLGRYLRTLEELIIRTCKEYGVTGSRVEGRTGVWVGPDESGPERKVCAMGVRCSRWVTMHGFAFNVTTNLEYFEHIVPCGISDRGVTSLERETIEPVDVDVVRRPLVRHFAELFDVQVIERSGDDALDLLEDVLGVGPVVHSRPWKVGLSE